MCLTCTPLPSASREWREGRGVGWRRGGWVGEGREGKARLRYVCVDGVERDYGVAGR